MPQKISHTGIVENIDEDGIFVRIKPSAGEASASGAEQNFVQVPLRLQLFSVGETVNVVLKQPLGKKAVALVYLLPVVILLGCLSLLLFAGVTEGVAGLSSLGILALYYAVLYICRDKLDKEPYYSIEKKR
ncbi:MAG: SoxR reducing system RseC family protein [Prevotellaceae bacterium]|jgi:sigma-E factor negative regulatory protein RseC|nr:SoxR reducing system RseC family protein [Prevotellaceae bacterium]